MDWQGQLISLYLFICNEFRKNLAAYCQRMTNHADLTFTDEEVVTIFLFGVMNKRKEIMSIYHYTNNHLKDWFPTLPGYVAFVQRLNRISEVFPALVESLQAYFLTHSELSEIHLMDSMPIILAQRTRRFGAKVAQEVASPGGFCVTKRLHYYGLKLHAIANYRKGSLPIPAYIELTPANIFDGRVYDEIRPLFANKIMVADKAYQKAMSPIFTEDAVTLYTPVKKKKGQEFLDSSNKLLSRAISAVRQPIESFFNWIEEKTQIQIASKVRSLKGLMVHIYGRLAAAFLMLKSRMGDSCS
jgi:hypothetical protein